jgi:hypothetical protein
MYDHTFDTPPLARPTRTPLIRRSLALVAAFSVIGALQGCKPADTPKDGAKKDPKADPKVDPKTDPKTDPEVVDAVAPSTGCTVDFTSETVDGATLWSDIPDASAPANCNFHRFAYNNFLYFVGGGDTPRFLTELASTADLKTGAPFPGDTTTLKLRGIKNTISGEPPPESTAQAGDGFSLIDAASNMVQFDIRINEAFWNVANQQSTATLAAAHTAYEADPATGGLWLSPTAAGDGDSIEIKTSWRNFGADASACPQSLMFCESDTDGNTWGLLGMHFVQKTPTRGEFVWASFEHVSNSPDCQPGASNPLQQDPRDPTNPSATINVNTGALAAETGWSVFNFSSYGGDGTSCEFPKGTINSEGDGCDNPSGSPQCNADPNAGAGKFKFVNVCRTDTIPDHSTPASLAAVCADTKTNDNNIACLNQSVLDNWPTSLDPRWKYYMDIGAEWLDATSVPLVGCVNITKPDGTAEFTCPTPTVDPPPSFQTFKITGTTALANTTMETWMQDEMCQVYATKNGSEAFAATDCFTCHTPQTNGGSTADFSHVFSVF